LNPEEDSSNLESVPLKRNLNLWMTTKLHLVLQKLLNKNIFWP